jgi:hypothetical protein
VGAGIAGRGRSGRILRVVRVRIQSPHAPRIFSANKQMVEKIYKKKKKPKNQYPKKKAQDLPKNNL